MRRQSSKVALWLAVVVITGAVLLHRGWAFPVHAEKLARLWGFGYTGVIVQNVDPNAPVNVEARFYDIRTGDARPPMPTTLAPGASWLIPWPGAYPPGQDPARHGTIVTSDGPVVAVNRTQRADTGAAVMYGNVKPGKEVAVPWVSRGYRGQQSLITIQNTEVHTKTLVRLTLIGRGDRPPGPVVSTVMTAPLNAGATLVVDLANQHQFAHLTTSKEFIGWLRVKSTVTRVAVEAFVDFQPSERAASAFAGMPVEDATDKLFVPLFRSNYYGTTGIAVVNPGDEDLRVRLDYYGSPLSPGCPNGHFMHNSRDAQGNPRPDDDNDPAVRVPANSSIVFYQGGPTEAGYPSLPILPDGRPIPCFGSAVIEVLHDSTGEGEDEGGVLAVVNDYIFSKDLVNGVSKVHITAAAYNAVGLGQGAKRIAVPLVRNHYTGMDLITGIQAMNVGSVTGTVTIRFINTDGTERPGPPGTVVNANASYTWVTSAMPELPSNWYGSALVESDQPLAVAVVEASLPLPDGSNKGTYNGSDTAAYNGINAEVKSSQASGMNVRVRR